MEIATTIYILDVAVFQTEKYAVVILCSQDFNTHDKLTLKG